MLDVVQGSINVTATRSTDVTESGVIEHYLNVNQKAWALVSEL
jgi:hypothetical protein